MIYIAVGLVCIALVYLAVETVIKTLEDISHYEESKNHWKKLEGPK